MASADRRPGSCSRRDLTVPERDPAQPAAGSCRSVVQLSECRAPAPHALEVLLAHHEYLQGVSPVGPQPAAAPVSVAGGVRAVDAKRYSRIARTGVGNATSRGHGPVASPVQRPKPPRRGLTPLASSHSGLSTACLGDIQGGDGTSRANAANRTPGTSGPIGNDARSGHAGPRTPIPPSIVRAAGRGSAPTPGSSLRATLPAAFIPGRCCAPGRAHDPGRARGGGRGGGRARRPWPAAPRPGLG